MRLTLPATLIGFLIIVTAWTTAAKLLWWESFGRWLVSGDNWVESGYRFLLCLGSLLLVFSNLHSTVIKRAVSPNSLHRIASVAAVLLIAFASVRSDQLFNTMSYSHWSVITGPAQMIRQGAWLLWDAPSQYGFLNIVATAVLPVRSVWQSAYLINSFLLFCSATVLFFVLRLGRSGWLNFFFALAVTLAAVFLMAGWPPALLGPQVFPSLGPFRFIWCYVLVLILLLDYRTDSKPNRRLLLFAGCIGWVIATFWSSESAAYAAACWLPSYALLIYQLAHEKKEQRDRLRVMVRWGLLPLILLAISIGAIAAFYFIRLGQAPEWKAFYEYSLAFAGGFFAIPIDINGPVSTLFLTFCVVSTAVFLFLRRGLRERGTPLMIAVWGLLWSVSSYFVSRSHSNNATVLTPLLCLVMGLTIYLLMRQDSDDRWNIFIKTVFVPVFAVILITTFGNAGFLRLYLTSPKLVYEKNIDTHLPAIDPSLLELFKQAQVKPNDPIVYSTVRVKAEEPLADGLSHDHGVLLPAWRHEDGQLSSSYRSWLPTNRQANAIALVSRLTCAVALADNEEVARLSITDSNGAVETLSLRAGQHTAEWTHDSQTVKSQVKHRRAEIFESFAATMDGQAYQAHNYVATMKLSSARAIKSIEVRWTGSAGSLVIEKLNLLDESTGQWEPVSPLAADNSRWRFASESDAAQVYENLNARPRAWLVSEAVTLQPDEILKAIKTSKLPDGRSFRAEQTVLVEEQLRGGGDSDAGATASVEQLAPTTLQVRTSSAADSFLITSDTWYPGWQATIDGKPAPIFRANYALRGVSVPAGTHNVKFEFRPRLFYFGVALSVLSVLVLSGILTVPRVVRGPAFSKVDRGRQGP